MQKAVGLVAGVPLAAMGAMALVVVVAMALAMEVGRVEKIAAGLEAVVLLVAVAATAPAVAVATALAMEVAVRAQERSTRQVGHPVARARSRRERR